LFAVLISDSERQKVASDMLVSGNRSTSQEVMMKSEALIPSIFLIEFFISMDI
jgi:hypothetical protein